MPLTRRTWIILAGLGSIAPSLGQERKTRSFLMGRITAISSSAIHIVSGAGPATLLLYAPPRRSEIWKGHPDAFKELRPGDFFYADVEPDNDGRLWIKKLWANIVNYFGLISAVRDDGFELIPYQPEPASYSLRIRVNSDTIHDNGHGSVKDIRQGLSAQVVGVVQPDATILATRIWVYTN